VVRKLFERGGAIALATLVFYIWLAPDYIVDGDNAEMSALAVTGGVAHPSGYPLFVLWLRLTRWLPGSSPAHTAAIATAILAAASIFVLHAACRAWGAKPAAASIACALVATAPVVLRMSTEAEVFALNDLVIAAVLWLAATDGPLRGFRRAGALGLVAGLGIANHLTCVAVAPVGLYGIVLAWREAKPAVVAVAIAGLVIGLLPYLYLFVAPTSRQSWMAVRSFDDLVGMVTRRDYGGLGTFAASGDNHGGENELALLATFARSFLWLPLVAAGYAVVVRIRDRATRWPWLALAVSFVLAGPLLVSSFNMITIGVSGYVVRRFYIASVVVLAVPVAVGLAMIGARLAPRAGRFGRGHAGDALAIAVFLAGASLALSSIVRAHSAAVSRGVENTLRSLPEGAAIITTYDDLYCGSNSLQAADGLRPDVRVLTPTTDAGKLERHGVPPFPGIDTIPPGPQLARALMIKRVPVFVDPGRTDILTVFPSYPYGTLMRVLPPGTPIPSLDEIAAINTKVYDAFVIDYAIPSRSDDFAAFAQLRYSDAWTWLGTKLDAAGRKDDAQRMYGIAAGYAPTDD
jgi:hypothetical protein